MMNKHSFLIDPTVNHLALAFRNTHLEVLEDESSYLEWVGDAFLRSSKTEELWKVYSSDEKNPDSLCLHLQPNHLDKLTIGVEQGKIHLSKTNFSQLVVESLKSHVHLKECLVSEKSWISNQQGVTQIERCYGGTYLLFSTGGTIKVSQTKLRDMIIENIVGTTLVSDLYASVGVSCFGYSGHVHLEDITTLSTKIETVFGQVSLDMNEHYEQCLQDIYAPDGNITALDAPFVGENMAKMKVYSLEGDCSIRFSGRKKE